ncbi:hypothetical protein Hanom_Chr15g01412711 [Helianthus anomalus]
MCFEQGSKTTSDESSLYGSQEESKISITGSPLFLNSNTPRTTAPGVQIVNIFVINFGTPSSIIHTWKTSSLHR